MIKMEDSIELRTVINPDDGDIYDFIQKIRKFLVTNSSSTIVRFILGRVAKIPFEEFINLVNAESDSGNTQEQSELIKS